MLSYDKGKMIIDVGARSSALSLVQVQEVKDLMQQMHPHVEFCLHSMSTIGDRDQTTSLRTLAQTDFFTRDIDEWVLQKKGRVGVHSAKDLPETLPKGLLLFCITSGIDPSDSLVLRSGFTLENLPIGSRIATSSIRREGIVRSLRSDLVFCDIRGTIEQRLDKLESGEVDGVVIAEAAIIRLRLTHVNRICLPGHTVEGQGKLAVLGREDDHELRILFSSMNEK
jgi:hydroxymethylbilane synthase